MSTLTLAEWCSAAGQRARGSGHSRPLRLRIGNWSVANGARGEIVNVVPNREEEVTEPSEDELAGVVRLNRLPE